jgi:hypothetical protein
MVQMTEPDGGTSRQQHKLTRSQVVGLSALIGLAGLAAYFLFIGYTQSIGEGGALGSEQLKAN